MNRVLATNLLKALKQVKQTKMSKLPVLNHAKFEFSNGELIITTTDLENPLQAKCPCILEDEWSTCVSMVTKFDVSTTYRPVYHKGYPIMDFVKVCAEYEDVLEFTFNPKIQTMTIKIQGERSITEFKCIDAEEFPIVEL